MKNLLISLLFLVAQFIVVQTTSGQSAAGDWSGDLEIQGMKLKIVFHVTDTDGMLTTTMDSPDQGAFGLAVDNTTYENDQLIIDAKSMGIKYIAKLDDNGEMLTGEFNQNGMNLPLTLGRMAVKKNATEAEGITFSSSEDAEAFMGKWHGAVELSGMKLRMTIDVFDEDGVAKLNFTSVDQSTVPFPANEVTVNEKELNFELKNFGINYKGELNAEGDQIIGKLMQGGSSDPLILTREAIGKTELVRPQEPTDFPYQQEDVKFANKKGGHNLAGTLTKPNDDKFDRVVVLVSGSGPQNRDEELLGHKPFLVLSDHLTRNGIAVLRYDDRGVGESTGDFKSATTKDLADDAKAAVMYLSQRADMKGKQIGIAGHSEGGMIAPIVASETDKVDFIALLAGPGINIIELMMIQTAKIATVDNGVSEDELAVNQKSQRRIFDYLVANHTMEKSQLNDELMKICMDEYSKFPDKMKEDVGDNPDAYFQNQVNMMVGDWFLYFMTFTPEQYLTQVKCPVLAINGEMDVQVTAKENLEGIAASLEKAGNKDVTIKEFKGLNHLFQKSETGSTNEYAKLEETFNQDVLTYISGWINGLN